MSPASRDDYGEFVSSRVVPEITNPSPAYPIIAIVALVASLLLAGLQLAGLQLKGAWPFVGYLLAPIAVIVMLVLTIAERNRNATNAYFEQTISRRNVRLLTIMVIISLVPAYVHSQQIARQVTLWSQ